MILEESHQHEKKTVDNELRYLSPIKIETKVEKKYCFFEKNNIKYIDYKDPMFLIKFLNAQGKILPRRITGTLQKYQNKLNAAIKRCRQIGLLPFVTDDLR
ncbi:30S ribosomal protein S18 [Blattabacterium cuenoti]|uniref:Small ribosomal subunit protein bS18 n=1 Tax=Blattabacterium cuenoti STAT TaxID=1457030 RepID=A0A224AKB1_9FLAO|nr:30S ribosomal protein S18 [Blattabacterium cuenoti]BBA17238.1 30S ribosomal protein S18 [Blattabacterium cuenoti STAT]